MQILENEPRAMTYTEVYDSIFQKKLYDFKEAKTPKDTISAQLGEFIRHNDSRVKRVTKKGGFVYYLAKYEARIDLDSIPDIETQKGVSQHKTYQERDLHILLSTYLHSQSIYSKTIFHEKSTNKDKQQKWVHPDMVGVQFTDINQKNAKKLLKITNQSDAYKLTSYELKRTINSDYELKEGYFQAVSNSSWANYGYLVAYEINSNLVDEIERLNQSFGIGVIELNFNPFESKILFPSKHNEVDFTTINKLCKLNKEFDKLIEQIEKSLTAPDNYTSAVMAEFLKYCDNYMIKDTDIEKYCNEKNIPTKDST